MANDQSYYATGTASVANGGTSVTGVGTYWDGIVYEGDLFYDPTTGLMARIAADATSDTGLTLAHGWPGAALSGDSYEILFRADSIRNSERARQVIDELSVVAANGRGLFMRFDDGTADADPGSGNIRFNNADITLATAAYIDNLDANGATISAIIDSWDDQGGSADRGQLWARSIADPSVFHALKMTGSVVDGTGYRKLTLEYIGGSGSFAADDELMIQPPAKGNQGAAFTWSGDAADPAGLTAFEGEADGYRVFVLDLGATEFGSYAGRGGVVEWNGTDTWSLIAIYTGPKGDTGDRGWAPQLVTEADGARRVFKLAGYVGGEGAAPTANVGEYLKSDGTFTATIGDAMDFAGGAGPAGVDGTSLFTRVRVVDTTGAAVATAYENGDTIDGVVLATNDLVLRATSGGNASDGVYVVPASGAASRSAAFAAYNDHPGVYFSVMEGTSNADTLWRCTSNKGGTLGSTALVFTQFSSGLPTTSASSSGSAAIQFHEDTDNGSNKVTVKAPASIASDFDLVLPATAPTAGQKLRQNAVGTGLEFESGWETIGQASFSGVASVEWTGLSAFESLRLTAYVLPATDAVNINLRTDANNGASFDAGGSDYTRLYLSHNSAAPTTIVAGTGDTNAFIMNLNSVGNAANEGVQFEAILSRFNKAEHCKCLAWSNGITPDGTITTNQVSYRRNDTTARDALQLIASSGNITGRYILEGIRG